GVVAEYEGAARFWRKRLPRRETVEVHKIVYGGDLMRADAVSRQEAFPAQIVHGDIFADGRKSWGALLPWYPAVTHKDGGRFWKMQGCRHCLVMVMPVDYIWGFGNLGEIIDNGDGCRLQFFGDRSEHGAVGDRIVPFSDKL